MRILHVIPYISPTFGGPPQVVMAMVNTSILNGHDVNILTTTAGLNGNRDGTSSNFYDYVNYHLFPTSFSNQWFYSKSLINKLKDYVGVVDILHLHIPFTAPFFFAARWAKKNKIPYVITTHGMLDSWSMNHKKIKKWLYYFFIEKFNLKGASKIHVTSTFEKIEVERLRLGTKIEIITPPVNFDKFSSNSNLLNNVIETPLHSPPHLLFIGRLHPVKGIPYLLKAIEILNKSKTNVILDLAGSGEPAYEEILKDIIERYKIKSSVILHNYVDEEKKQILYKRASIFIFPSLHENFGLAAAEAMMAGLPVVVTDQVGLAADVAKYGAGIVVPSSDSNSIASAIEIILKSRHKKMAKAALELANIEYDPKRFSERLNAFYS